MDISPDKQNIDRVFSNTTYHIDFYQRDYKWTAEPVRRLIDDIFYNFEDIYRSRNDLDPSRENVVANYPWYYLNTYVTNTIDGRVYVVDGQQRLTTLTLFLIKLHHMAVAFESQLADWIKVKIAGQDGFQKRFWMNHERHLAALQALYEDNDVIPTDSGLTAINMLDNYKLIEDALEERLDTVHKFETFVFYFMHRMVLINLSVEQTDVPMVFEVINDRGVRLRPYANDSDKFEIDRNRLGGVLLLKGKDNISSGNEPYLKKLKSYSNTLHWNETLRQDSYKAKKDFADFINRRSLSFQPHNSFGPEEVESRQKLLFDMATIIWSVASCETSVSSDGINQSNEPSS